MNKYSSKNTEVQKFLDDLESENSNQYEILQKCRELIYDTDKNVTEEIKYGGVYFSQDSKAFGGIFPYSQHLSFEFSKGASFNDPEKVLEGRGKNRRHIKLENISDIENKSLEKFIEQALNIKK
ncbi:DUF1801 domain-containing protein [Candidatus Gracilibacteria bacterium]|nr:DUF1801 domain-containing protein [Candidatus Gracilibacteria bacterium]